MIGSVNGVTWLGQIPVYYEGSKNIEKGDNLTGYGTLHIEKGYIDAFSDNYWIEKTLEIENFENAVVIKIVMPQVKAESVTVQPGENAVSRISLSEAPNGLSGYKMTVNLNPFIVPIFQEENLTATVENEDHHVSIGLSENAPIVEYVENITQLFPPRDAADISGISFPEWATISNVERLGPDSVRIEAVDLDEKIQAGDENVTLARIHLENTELGWGFLSLDIKKLDDDNGENILHSTFPGFVAVVPPEIVPGRGPVTDPDGDGLFEDINSNWKIDYDDIVELFKHMDKAREHSEYFDFNGNGRVDYDDVVKLFEEI
ncbi:hypothetical protein AKJ65_03230 [candidate division MSBL1 archaeon SCGC-AAA259E19]|uniref:EF-hand domain-containing protein n=1 Tax=candidate division MSBL1 archaeon SCGC-AAA259E19 TaxID=1698264 RepID=A0A133UL17_9EURY|nr:hypothetical protein AKJ65_03230 [candidate division MSBL1 archaeon SCGC-AAA259E19]